MLRTGLPSQTTARFLMLVAAVLGTATFAYRLILVNPAAVLARVRCLTDNPIPTPPTLDSPATESPEAVAARAACVNLTEVHEVRNMLVGVGLVAAATLLLYLLLPLWDRYRRRLRPLDPSVHGEVLAELDLRVAEAGLRRRPTFLYSLSPRVNANTFGAFPRYYVRLDGGLLTTFVTDRPAFTALIRHELAHLRFRDVDVTRLTVALSLAFPLAVLVPYVVRVTAAFPLQSLRADGWRLAALAALVGLSAASVLRARELAADAWAASVGAAAGAAGAGAADEGALARVLARQQQGAGLWWRLGELVGSHPRAERRVAELTRPRALWRVGLWEAVGAGLAGGIAAAPLFDVVALSYQGAIERVTAASLASGLVIGALGAGVVGTGLWRATLAARTGGADAPGTLLPGLGLGLGIVGGYLIAWQSSLDTGLVDFASFLGGQVAVSITIVVLLVLAEILYCRWVVLGASAWLPTVRRQSPGWSSCVRSQR